MKIMKRLRRTALLFLSLILLAAGAVPAWAAQTGSISVTLKDEKNQKLVTGGEITLYQVASAVIQDGKADYVYVNGFENCGIQLGDLSDSGLAGKLNQKRTASTQGTAKTIDDKGHVEYQDLEQGLYLLVQTKASAGYEKVRPFLVSVPLKTEQGWEYNVDASPKMVTITQDKPHDSDEPDEPDKPNIPKKPSTHTSGNPPKTPDTPETETPPETSDVPDTPDTEETLDVPENSDVPEDVPKLPQTGQLNWPVPVLSISGLLLFSAGWILKREDHEE